MGIYNFFKNHNSLLNVFYKEKTNVFAYYIVKTILLYFKEDFLEEINRIDNTLKDLEFSEQLSGEHDSYPAIISLSQGAGYAAFWREYSWSQSSDVV